MPVPDPTQWSNTNGDSKVIPGLFDVNVDKLLLIDYRRDSNTSWRPTNRQFNLYQQQKDPSDQNDIKRLSSVPHKEQ